MRPGMAALTAATVLALACHSTRHGRKQGGIGGSGSSTATGGTSAGASVTGGGSAGQGRTEAGSTGDGGAAANGGGDAGTGGSSDLPEAPTALLDSLSLSQGELSPAFAPDVFEYQVKLSPLASARLRVSASALVPQGEILLDETEPLSPSSWAELTIDVGQRVLTIDVDAPGYAPQRYTISVQRAGIAETQSHVRTQAYGHAWDEMGSAVAVGPGWIALGLPKEDGLLVNAAPSQYDAGAVHVFGLQSDGLWAAERLLMKGSGINDKSAFGTSLAADGNRLLVGAPTEYSFPEQGIRGGAAYVFERVQGALDPWKEVERLLAPSPAEGAQFGKRIALAGDTAVVAGATADAELFHLDGDSWVHEKTISLPAAPEAMALGSDHLVVTDSACGTNIRVYTKGNARDWFGACAWAQDIAFSDTPHALAISGDLFAAGYPDRIALYARTGASWHLQSDLILAPTAQFGSALALAGDRLFAGVPDDRSPALGINGDAADQSETTPIGAVYFYRKTAQGWVQEGYFKPSGVELGQVSGAGFGTALDFAHDVLAVGAPLYDASVTAPPPEPFTTPVLGEPAGAGFFYR